MNDRPLLSHKGAKRYYDKLGSLLDTQAFYEQIAVRDLARHLGLQACDAVAEFGCGTGRFAAEIFETYLPQDAIYLGIDMSDTMVALAKDRLSRYGPRAEIRQSDGQIQIDRPDHTFDCIICTYVLDLLSEEDIRDFLREAHRTLKTGGRVGLVSLTKGRTPLSGMLSAAWSGLHRTSPWLVGGCRPIEIAPYLQPSQWRTDYQRVIAPFGLPSEILVASALVGN